jgi:citrate lyase subunit beta / citryl-CoA lyase
MRSLLYVPASSERFIAKAHERGADAIILESDEARSSLGELFFVMIP